MKSLPLITLAAALAVTVGCGTTRENRYNETAYADHPPYDRDVDVVPVEPTYRMVPAYRMVPVTRGQLIYGGEGYHYHRY